MAAATASVNGYLTSANFTTFNNKFTLPSLTSGSVLFSNGSTIAQDNATFFWDNTYKSLKITSSSNGTSNPYPLHVIGVNSVIKVENPNATGVVAIRMDLNGLTQTSLSYSSVSGQTLLSSNYGSLSLLANGTYGLTIATSGAATFDKSVNIGASATTGKQLIVNQTGATGYFLSGEASGTELAYWYYDASTIQFSSKSATRALTFLTNDTTRLTIASTGEATFTSSVTATQFIAKSASGAAAYFLKDTSLNNKFEIGHIANAFYIYNYTTAGDSLRVTSSNNIEIPNSVSIGVTISSNTRLTVKGGDATSANYSFVANNSAQLTFGVRNDGLIETGTAANSPYNVTATGRNAVLSSSGVLGYLVSTRESKENIESIKNIDFINQLNPVQFNYRKKDYTTNEFTDELYDNVTYGFIADEVEKVNKELAFYNEDGTLAGVEYNSIIAILTKAVQEQNKTITSLQDRLDKLENK
jgi:hypothetical protein